MVGVRAHDPNSQNQCEKRNEARDDAVRVLEADAADEGRNQASVGERPVGDRVAGVIVGHQRAGHQKQDRAAGGRDREAVESAGRLGLVG